MKLFFNRPLSIKVACCSGLKCNDVETFDNYFQPKSTENTENGSSSINDRYYRIGGYILHFSISLI